MSKPAIVATGGVFPAETLDQGEYWMDPNGNIFRVSELRQKEAVLWAMDYLLANARFLREAWTMKTRQEYDTEQRARRWMLDRPLTRALMKRLVQLDRKQEVEDAFNSYTPEPKDALAPEVVSPPSRHTSTLGRWVG